MLVGENPAGNCRLSWWPSGDALSIDERRTYAELGRKSFFYINSVTRGERIRTSDFLTPRMSQVAVTVI